MATWLGWWSQIIHEPLRNQRWVRIVPIALLLVAAIGTSAIVVSFSGYMFYLTRRWFGAIWLAMHIT